jgi:phosphate transport system substrate-binding protein
MTFMQLQNRSGRYVSPDDLTFAAAADGADWFSVPGMGLSIVDQKNPQAWPISSASFIIMYKNPKDKNQSQEVLKFFDWAFRNGGNLARELDYVPLPGSLQQQIRDRVWSQIQK